MKKYVSKDYLTKDVVDVSKPVTQKQELQGEIVNPENHNSEKGSVKEELDILNEKKNSINRELASTKSKIQNLKKPASIFDCCFEEVQRRLEAAEHRLRTADISKKQQNQLNSRIVELKRILPKARPGTEVRSEINKLKNLDDILSEELKEVKEEIKQKSKASKQTKPQVNKQKVEPQPQIKKMGEKHTKKE